jgi:hypothetical protein
VFLATASANRPQVVPSQNFRNTAIVEAASAEALANISETPKNTDENLEKYVRSYFEKTPILAEISRCESKFKQFKKDGSVMRGILTPEDVGLMQINEFFHKDRADKLGFDLHTVEGNLGYAQYLYDRQGTQPWSASAYCWGKA